MPSINEVIERVNRARPDAIDDETKAAWLMELDGQIFERVILRHRLTPGRVRRGPVGVCPVCGGYGEGGEEDGKEPVRIHYDRVMDCSSCPECGWSELPEYPKQFPEDEDMPLLVGPPYDGLYDLYLMSKADFANREMDNYNNSALAYNSALDEWKKAYHQSHMPIGAGGYTNIF